MKITLDDWYKDVIESRLDRMGLAFIEFTEFAHFLQGFNVSFNEELPEMDLEEQLE